MSGSADDKKKLTFQPSLDDNEALRSFLRNVQQEYISTRRTSVAENDQQETPQENAQETPQDSTSDPVASSAESKPSSNLKKCFSRAEPAPQEDTIKPAANTANVKTKKKTPSTGENRGHVDQIFIQNVKKQVQCILRSGLLRANTIDLHAPDPEQNPPAEGETPTQKRRRFERICGRRKRAKKLHELDSLQEKLLELETLNQGLKRDNQGFREKIAELKRAQETGEPVNIDDVLGHNIKPSSAGPQMRLASDVATHPHSHTTTAPSHTTTAPQLDYRSIMALSTAAQDHKGRFQQPVNHLHLSRFLSSTTQQRTRFQSHRSLQPQQSQQSHNLRHTGDVSSLPPDPHALLQDYNRGIAPLLPQPQTQNQRHNLISAFLPSLSQAPTQQQNLTHHNQTNLNAHQLQIQLLLQQQQQQQHQSLRSNAVEQSQQLSRHFLLQQQRQLINNQRSLSYHQASQSAATPTNLLSTSPSTRPPPRTDVNEFKEEWKDRNY